MAVLTITFSCSQPEKEVKVIEDAGISLDFRPNIVWIVAEDLGPYIPAFGDSTIVTPHLDRLAASGISFDNFYTPHPVCAPARAAIITGMYANKIGASHMRTGPWFPGVTAEGIKRYARSLPEGFEPYEAIPPPEVRMFTEYLRKAGYYTTNNSKEDYQFRKTMTAWDESSNKAHWKNRPPGKPFFSVFNIGVTHESRIWAKSEDSLWVDKDLRVPVPPYLPDSEVATRDVRRMYSNILEMDARVGELLNELEDAGQLDSTIVFWYTDHGGPLPRQKRMLYESGVKVPMIIRFPGQTGANTRDDRMVSFIDLAPTVMSLAGLQPPKYMDGKAFLGPETRTVEPRYAFGAADRFDELMDRARSVTDGKFKYIRYYMPEKPMLVDVGYRRQMPIMMELIRLHQQEQLTPAQALWFRETKPDEELFDLQNDPHELNNLASDPDYQDQLKEMRQVCADWTSSFEDTGLMPEEELIGRFWPDDEQPQTKDPIPAIINGKLEVSCETEGASIGFRYVQGDGVPSSWTIYYEPIRFSKGTEIEIVAHRIGFLRSDTIVFSLD